jgi:hypothetical protein
MNSKTPVVPGILVSIYCEFGKKQGMYPQCN